MSGTLDFSILDALVENENEKTAASVYDNSESQSMYAKLEAEQRGKKRQNAAANKQAEIYKAYQDNIKASGRLQTEILKGIKQGADGYSLFLKAVKAISLMTSDIMLYSQIEADIIAIHGAGLLQPAPLDMELDAVQARLERLREAEIRDGETEDTRRRIAAAIKAHEDRAENIRELLSHTLKVCDPLCYFPQAAK